MAKLVVEVTPRARKPGIAGRRGEVLKVKVVAPPTGGRANEEVIARVADFLGIPKKDVVIIAGLSNRRKVLEVRNLGANEVAASLSRVEEMRD